MAFSLSAPIESFLATSHPLAYGSILIASLLFLSNWIYSYRRLSHIPGPFEAALSKSWIVRANRSGRTQKDIEDITHQYGPLARIGPNILLSSDPDVIRRMNAPRSPYRRSDWYNAMRLKPRVDNVISTKNEDRHDELRRMMAAGYSGKENLHLESSIDNRLADLCDLMSKKYTSSSATEPTKRLDFGRIIQYFTLDVISDLAFGAPFGDLTDDEDKFKYIETTEGNLPVIILMTIWPSIHKFLETSRIMNLVAPSAADRTGLGPIIKLAEEKVAERFGEKKVVRKDMLGSFITHGLSQSEAESETVFQILAGSDTTATAIRSIILYIITSPSVYRKLMDEIDAGIADGKISSPITDAEAKELPYLQAVIKEGLRVHPPVAGLMEKVVPEGGDEISGYFVPGGTVVGYSVWAIHRSSLFGPDPTTFRPERWLDPTLPASTLQTWNNNLDLIFGHGRFQCLGKTVAMIELNKTFVEVLRRFELRVLEPEAPWKSFNVGIFMQSKFWVGVSEREGGRK